MLTQARDVACTETETALEAALLESDEIKRLAPPFNVALVGRRAVGLVRDGGPRAGAARGRTRSTPPGPFVSPAPVEALSALRARPRRRRAGPARRCGARAVGVEPAYAPGPECFAAGLARVRAASTGRSAGTRGLLRLGARLWARRRAAAAAAARTDDGAAGEPTPSPAGLGSRSG